MRIPRREQSDQKSAAVDDIVFADVDDDGFAAAACHTSPHEPSCRTDRSFPDDLLFYAAGPAIKHAISPQGHEDSDQDDEHRPGNEIAPDVEEQRREQNDLNGRD